MPSLRLLHHDLRRLCRFEGLELGRLNATPPTDALISPDQATYIRIAPMMSIISFYVGYDPTLFAALLDRVRKFLDTGSKSGN